MKVQVKADIGFPSERDRFTYFVAATGRRRRVIAASLANPLPRGWRIYVKLDPLSVGKSTGYREITGKETILIRDIWGIYNEKGTGEVKMETDLDAPQGDGRIEINFKVRKWS